MIPVGTPSLAIQPDLSVHNLITRIAVQGYFCFSSGHFPVLNLRSCRTFKVDVQVVYSHPVAMFQGDGRHFPMIHQGGSVSFDGQVIDFMEHQSHGLYF